MKKYLSIVLMILVQFSFAHFAANEGGYIYDGHHSVVGINPEKVILTPNPAMDNTMVKVIDNKAQVIQISIYSLLGNQIFSKNYTLKEKNVSLNIQGFKKGKYLIKVTFQDGTSEVKALIKQ